MSKNRLQFVDKAKISVQSGNGGNGCSSFRREKHLPKGGPDGGNGGNGADIIFKACHNEKSLLQYKLAPQLKAENGAHGKGSDMHARNMAPKIFLMPLGTQIFDEDGELLADLSVHDQIFLAAKGGKGGYGNNHFKTPTDQAPTFAEKGSAGQTKIYHLQLKVLADVGIIGMPNAGKSSFLRCISNATPEVANYPFTTINPQLGTVKHNNDVLVFADIPGLIEFASLGKGLGYDFLSHIERCNTLLHLIDINLDVLESYKMIRHELKEYSEELIEKTEIVAFNKTDCLPEEDIEAKKAAFQAIYPNISVFVCSTLSKQGVKEILSACFKIACKK